MKMKILLEYNENTNVITEQTEDGTKNYFIEGIFMQSEKVNRNKRSYPKHLMEREVNRFVNEYVIKKRALGELNHPVPPNPTLDLSKASHLITELVIQENNVMGRAKIINTPMGKIAKNFIDEGIQLGVSSRAMGSTTSKNGINVVNEDFKLATIDIVADPSAPDAFVTGLMEGKEWVWENGQVIQKDIEEIKEIVESAKPENRNAKNIEALYTFLSKF